MEDLSQKVRELGLVVEFIQEHMGRPHGEFEEETLRLALEYHDETEAFDKRACSREAADGTAVPVGTREILDINRNARKVFANKAKVCRQGPEALWSAIREVGRYYPELRRNSSGQINR